ncbi:MAG: aldo/keto reductase [Clostridia bacterium]
MEKIKLSNGENINKLGQGTWNMGENLQNVNSEIATIKKGIDLGLNLLDTAEMYGEGNSERFISKAIEGVSRDDLFIVSKVYPHNACNKKLEKSLDKSLKNLKTDYLDMYLLHWKGSVPLEETVFALEEQVKKGKIKSWGVSNFDTRDMEQLLQIENGKNCRVNQVMYHLGSRGVEYDLLPYLTEQNIVLMAYCPLAQAGRLKSDIWTNNVVNDIAKKYNVSVANVLLNFIMRHKNVIAIPKASKISNVEDNARSLDFSLTDEDINLLNTEFPAPTTKQYLDIV